MACACLALAAAAPLQAQDTLLGVTWDASVLVSLDPRSGAVTKTHLQLDPYESFTALAHDPGHHRIFALAQGTQNLYAIDTGTLEIRHIGNLHVDTRLPGITDTAALAYDSFTDTLYTVVGRWDPYPDGPISSTLAAVDPATGVLTERGRLDGPWITSLAFGRADRRLYATGVFGAGAWDSPYVTHLFRIDPDAVRLDPLLVTPYHTMLGLAMKEPGTFFSWINWTTQFFGQLDLATGAVTPLGDAGPTGAIYAMLYKEVDLGSRPLVARPEPASFTYGGAVTSVWDPDGRLHRRVRPGHRFTGLLSYDASAPYKRPDPNAAPPYGITLSIDGYRFSSSWLGAWVANNYFDAESARVSDDFYLEAATASGAQITWSLVDPTARALAGNDRLPTYFDLSRWTENEFTVTGYDSAGERAVYQVEGTVDRVTSRQAALPSPRPERGSRRTPER